MLIRSTVRKSVTIADDVAVTGRTREGRSIQQCAGEVCLFYPGNEHGAPEVCTTEVCELQAAPPETDSAQIRFLEIRAVAPRVIEDCSFKRDSGKILIIKVHVWKTSLAFGVSLKQLLNAFRRRVPATSVRHGS